MRQLACLMLKRVLKVLSAGQGLACSEMRRQPNGNRKTPQNYMNLRCLDNGPEWQQKVGMRRDIWV